MDSQHPKQTVSEQDKLDSEPSNDATPQSPQSVPTPTKTEQSSRSDDVPLIPGNADSESANASNAGSKVEEPKDADAPIGEEDEDEEEPQSAFSFSSSEYSDRDESEGPLLHAEDDEGYPDEQGDDDRSNELEDFSASFSGIIGAHPDSVEGQTVQTSERPTTPPRTIVKPKGFSPRTRRRLDEEAARGYPYHDRPTRRADPSAQWKDLWQNDLGNHFHAPRRPRRADGSTGRYKIPGAPTPLKAVQESDDEEAISPVEDQRIEIERPANPEPPSPFDQADFPEEGEPLPRVSAVSDSAAEGDLSPNENNDSATDQNPYAIPSWYYEQGSWADQVGDEEEDLEINRLAALSRSNSNASESRRSSASSVTTQILPEVRTVENAEPVDSSSVSSQVAAPRLDLGPSNAPDTDSSTREASPVEDERPKSGTSIVVNVPAASYTSNLDPNADSSTRGVSPIEGERSHNGSSIVVNVPGAASPILLNRNVNGNGTSGLQVRRFEDGAQSEPLNTLVLYTDDEEEDAPVKPQPAVATTSSPLTVTHSQDVETSPVSPESISPQSATSLEVLEQLTQMDQETAERTWEEWERQIQEMDSGSPSQSKEEALARLRTNRALLAFKEAELEVKGELKKRKRRSTPMPHDTEELIKVLSNKAWHYREQRDNAKQDRKDLWNVIAERNDDVAELSEALLMRNQAVQELEERLERLNHLKKVAEEELKWAQIQCSKCGGQLDGDDATDDSCEGRCKKLREELKAVRKGYAALEEQTQSTAEAFEKYMNETAGIISERDTTITKNKRSIEARQEKIRELQWHLRGADDEKAALLSQMNDSPGTNAQSDRLQKIEKTGNKRFGIIQALDQQRSSEYWQIQVRRTLYTTKGTQTTSTMAMTDSSTETTTDTSVQTTSTMAMTDQDTQTSPIQDHLLLFLNLHEGVFFSDTVESLKERFISNPDDLAKSIIRGEAQRRKYRTELYKLNAHIKDRNRVWNELMEKINEKEARNLEMEARLRVAEENSREASTNAAEVKRLRAGLKATRDSEEFHRTKAEDWQKRYNAMRDEKKEEQRQHALLQGNMKKLQAKANEKPAYIDAGAQVDDTEAERIIADLKAQLKAKDQQLAIKDSSLEYKQQQFDAAEKAWKESTDRLTRQSDDYLSMFKELDTKYQNVWQKAQAKSHEVEVVERKRSQLMAEARELRAKNEELVAKNEEVVAELETKIRELEVKTEELETKKQVLQELTTQVQDLTSDKLPDAQTQELQQELSTTKQKLISTDEELVTTKRELASKTLEIEAKDEKLSQAVAEERRLRNMLGEAILIASPRPFSQEPQPAGDALAGTGFSSALPPLPATPLQLPTAQIPTRRVPSPLLTPTSTSPQPPVLPIHPSKVPVMPEAPPNSPFSAPRRPGWEAREAAWRNTTAYRNAMARFENKLAKEKAEREEYEAIRMEAIVNLARGKELKSYTTEENRAFYRKIAARKLPIKLTREEPGLEG